jgi:hypothetical protein
MKTIQFRSNTIACLIKYAFYKMTIGSMLIVICPGCDNKPAMKEGIAAAPTVRVSDWTVAGPFDFDTLLQHASTTFGNRDLEGYGVNEDEFDLKSIDIIKHSGVKAFKASLKDGALDFIELTGKELLNKSNYYLFSCIESDIEKEIVLIVDGSRNYKIWLNGEVLLVERNKTSTNKIGDRFIRSKIKKGKNIFLAKVNRGSNLISWKFFFTTASIEQSKRIYKINYLSDFLRNPVIKDSVQIYTGPYQEGVVKIEDESGKEIIRTKFFKQNIKHGVFTVKGLSTNSDGFYTCRLILEDDTLNERYYQGDLQVLERYLYSSFRSLKIRTEDTYDIDAGLQRFSYLLDKSVDDNCFYEIQYFNKNRVFYGYSVYSAIKFAMTHGLNLRNKPSTMLKAYYSKKENKVFNFLFHIHDKLTTKGRVPLVIVAPYDLSDEETMITGWYIGNLDQIENDIRLADSAGFAVAWPYMRGTEYSVEASEDDTFHVIKRLSNDYNIDSTQVYLIGDCVGGMRALLLAERNPDRFAGVAVKSPITLHGSKENIPVNFVSNLYNMPVFIAHGKNDENIPVEESKTFISAAASYGFRPKLVEIKDGHFSVSKDNRKTVFAFLDSVKNLKPAKNPSIIKYASNIPSKKVHWVEVKSKNPHRWEFVAEYDSAQRNFNITCQNIETFIIQHDNLALSGREPLTIFTNNKLSFNGIVSSDKIRISVD